MTLDEAVLAAANTSSDESTPSGLTVDLGTGGQLTFKDTAELSQELQKALAHVNLEVTKLKQENELIKSQTSQNTPKYAQSDDEQVGSKFDMDNFINHMKKDPTKAFDYVDSIRYGTEKPVEYIKSALKQIEEFKAKAEAVDFIKAHPEFPGGQAGVILDNIRKELGQPMTKSGLESSYAHAIQNNKLPDFRIQAAINYERQQFMNYLQQNNLPLPQQQTPQPQPQYNNVPQNQNPYPVMTNNGPVGIPTVPRNQPGNVNPNVVQAAENMSVSDLEKLLKQYGAL